MLSCAVADKRRGMLNTIVKRAYSTRAESRERESMGMTGNTGRKCLGLLIGFFACIVAPAQQPGLSVPPVDGSSGHPRVAIISDIGNEPDDQMSLTRLLLYSNEIEIEALIASHPPGKRPPSIRKPCAR